MFDNIVFTIYLLTLCIDIAIFILSLSLETYKITEFTTPVCNKFNFFIQTIIIKIDASYG